MKKKNLTIGIKKFKKVRWFIIFLVFVVCAVLLHNANRKRFVQETVVVEEVKAVDPFVPFEITIPVRLEFSADGGGFKEIAIKGAKITAYNNLPEQTNEQPNIGASMRKVFEGSCAVSRDILRDYKVHYGDILCIKQTKECYFIEDTMNKRYDGDNGKRVDIFMYSKSRALTTAFKSDIIILQQL